MLILKWDVYTAVSLSRLREHGVCVGEGHQIQWQWMIKGKMFLDRAGQLSVCTHTVGTALADLGKLKSDKSKHGEGRQAWSLTPS